jgi:hypothetical protein
MEREKILYSFNITLSFRAMNLSAHKVRQTVSYCNRNRSSMVRFIRQIFSPAFYNLKITFFAILLNLIPLKCLRLQETIKEKQESLRVFKKKLS